MRAMLGREESLADVSLIPRIGVSTCSCWPTLKRRLRGPRSHSRRWRYWRRCSSRSFLRAHGRPRRSPQARSTRSRPRRPMRPPRSARPARRWPGRSIRTTGRRSIPSRGEPRRRTGRPRATPPRAAALWTARSRWTSRAWRPRPFTTSAWWPPTTGARPSVRIASSRRLRAPAGGHDRSCQRGRPDQRQGRCRGQSQRQRDDIPLRAGRDHGVRHSLAGHRCAGRIRHRGAHVGATAHRTALRHDVPLPCRRHECLGSNHLRQRSPVHHRRRPTASGRAPALQAARRSRAACRRPRHRCSVGPRRLQRCPGPCSWSCPEQQAPSHSTMPPRSPWERGSTRRPAP